MQRIDGIGLELIAHVGANECDQRGRLMPANVFRMMTEMAGINAEQLGFGFQKMLARECYWVLSRLKVRFLRQPLSGETLCWRTWPKGYQQKLFFIRDFEVLDDAGQAVMLASSAWLVIHAATRRLMPPARLPGIDLPYLSGRVALDEPLEKLLVENPVESLVVQARYSDVDLLGHMNNARYVEAICDALPAELMTSRDLKTIQVNYDKEVRLGDQVSIRLVEQSQNVWGLEGFNLTSAQSAFTAQVQFCPERV